LSDGETARQMVLSPAIGVSNEDFNLMNAAEEYTDLIYNFTRNFTLGVDYAIEEGIISGGIYGRITGN